MFEHWSIKTKLLISMAGFIAISGALIAGFSLHEFTVFSQTTITDSYDALTTEAMEKMRFGLDADWQQVESLLDTTKLAASRLAASANMRWYFTADRQAKEVAEKEAARVIEGLLELCRVQNDQLQEKVKNALLVAEYIMTERYGAPATDELAPIRWDTVEQMTKAQISLSLPQLRFGAAALERQEQMTQPVPVVDDVQRILGVRCTIFQRMNDQGDLLRVATTIPAPDGRRAIGTYLPAKHSDNTLDPIIAAIMNGDTYSGREYIGNVWYISAYKPFTDAAGKIIGAIYVATPQQSDLLKGIFNNTRIGQSGEAFVIDFTGSIQLHRAPDMIGKNLILETGASELNTLLEAKSGEKTSTIEYASNGRKMAVTFRKFPTWNWVICLSYDTTEIEQDSLQRAKDALQQEILSLHRTTSVNIRQEDRLLFPQIRLLDSAGQEHILLNKGNFPELLSSHASAEWFQQSLALKPGEIYMTGAERVANTENAEMQAISPVYIDDIFKGLVVVNLTWDVVWEVLKDHIYGKTGYSYIINEQGMLISHPKYRLKDQKNLSDVEYGELATLVNEKMLKGEAGHSRYTFEGIDKFVAFRPLPIGSQTYTIAVTMPVNEVLMLAEKMKRETNEHYARTVLWVAIVAVFSIAAACGAAIWIGRSISRSVREVMAYTRNVAEGNLCRTLPINRYDEMGMMARSINQMVLALRSLIQQIQRSSVQVNSSAAELSATTKEQEVIMTTQVESTKQVVNSVHEISDVTNNLVETMRHVAETSQQTAQFASSGQADLQRMDEAMRLMDAASKAISSKLQAIHEKADNITAVITTITKVADQTNLLSLNAAIEAEKAGEYGRGFTVVAREIRRLADQTAFATLDIKEMVREMQSAVSSGVMEMEKFMAEVRHGTEDVERISAQFAQIIGQIQDLSPQFDLVNEAMQYQSDHAHEINAAVRELGEEMEETRAALQETFAAIGQLNEASGILLSAASQFTVSEEKSLT